MEFFFLNSLELARRKEHQRAQTVPAQLKLSKADTKLSKVDKLKKAFESAKTGQRSGRHLLKADPRAFAAAN